MPGAVSVHANPGVDPEGLAMNAHRKRLVEAARWFEGVVLKETGIPFEQHVATTRVNAEASRASRTPKRSKHPTRRPR